MFALMMNDMRSPKVEIRIEVRRAETREELEAFVAAEEVPNYRDDGWNKCHRKGGPLEWFNPLSMFGRIVAADS